VAGSKGQCRQDLLRWHNVSGHDQHRLS